jgi:MFS family permease
MLASLSAVFAGLILERFESPTDFSLLFLLAGISMAISWVSLSLTREPERAYHEQLAVRTTLWENLRRILRNDRNFAWFLVARMLSQLGMMGFAFYTVHAVKNLNMSELGVGIMTSVYLGAQIVLNPLMGWLGDRWSHRGVMEVGILAAVLSALVAWRAPSPGWFYVAFILAGMAGVAIWTIGLAIVLEFGSEPERPTYIGMANSLVAPATILAPLLGGWLADAAGYPTTFLATAFGGVATLLVLQFLVRDPRHLLGHGGGR